MFLCERFGCRLLPRACLLRQQRVRREGYESEMSVMLEPCFDCKQGNEIRKREEANMMVSKSKPEEIRKSLLKHPCTGCGERDAVLDKNGDPVNGLCKQCFADKRKASASSIKKHRLKLILDFTGHEKAFAKIEQRAASEFRSVEGQIMWDVLRVVDSRGRVDLG